MLRSPLGRGSLSSDPARANRLLLYAVLTAVILVLAALGYLVYAVVVRPAAPRTAVERQVLVTEQAAKAQPSNGRAWADYASALVESGQLTKAGQAVTDGLRLAVEKAPVLVEQARLEQVQGRAGQALDSAAQAIKEANAYRDKAVAEMRKKGVTTPRDSSPDIVEAELIRAEIYTSQGKLKQAVDAYTSALSENPRMADVLAMRGGAYAKMGDPASARADFREALRFDPENADARKGLETLGDAKQ